jgi:hypothetical protein
LEELGFPYPVDACHGPEAVSQVLAGLGMRLSKSLAGSRWRHTVAIGAEIVLRPSWTVVVKIRNREQNGR